MLHLRTHTATDAPYGSRCVFRVDPITDPRWTAFLEDHPRASIFHCPEWLQALKRTYGYQPVLLTTTSPDRPLANGIVLCRVVSWLTGARLVSLPFSDHCQVLADQPEDASALCGCLDRERADDGYRYVELRSLPFSGLPCGTPGGFTPARRYCLHTIDLRPALTAIFRKFHKNCIQRKIRRAEREGLTYEAGRSESLLAKFYHLFLLTRRRHQIPPQPKRWFRNLIDCLGDKVSIRVASKDGRPVASILTLSYKNTLVYKYGCSDGRLHNLGGMPLLFWNAIQEGKQENAREFDLGRSDIFNAGLIAFKEHLGATRSQLVYLRLSAQASHDIASGRQAAIARRIVGRMPPALVQMIGSSFYRHIG